ncbi:hypothetical protein HZY62_21370 [Maribacter polysiphoniae]|uniref:Uncharacterized protein n=1 Tax=Maribacter polysiphoniae TaxID=429344 RepID=A0ABR7W5K0_9FLAO|nr:hypothetical protein [Maribacter polysiphoniae]
MKDTVTEEIFKKMNEAYEVSSDEEKRKRYYKLGKPKGNFASRHCEFKKIIFRYTIGAE